VVPAAARRRLEPGLTGASDRQFSQAGIDPWPASGFYGLPRSQRRAQPEVDGEV